MELDGRIGHVGKGRFRDMRRDNTHVLLGRPTLRFGHADVLTRPCDVAGQVAGVLEPVRLGRTSRAVPALRRLAAVLSELVHRLRCTSSHDPEGQP